MRSIGLFLQVGLHPTAGQPIYNGYNTGLASPCTMGTINDRPAHTRWILYWAGQPVSSVFCTSSACQYELEKVQFLASQLSVKNHNPQLAYQHGVSIVLGQPVEYRKPQPSAGLSTWSKHRYWQAS